MAETTERIEYRVVGNRRGRGEVVIARYALPTACVAEEVAEPYRGGGTYSRVRVQSRTLTETPWEDLDEQAGVPGRG